MKIRIFFFILFPMLSSHQLFAETLTVDDAVRKALDNNLGLMRSALDVQTRQRNSDRSWNSLIPSVNLSAGINRSTAFIDSAANNEWTPGFSMGVSLTLSVSIIDNIKKAKTDYELGLLSLGAARQELELQVRKLFYQILLLDANRELAVQSFTSAQARYEQSGALARVGQVSRLDELSARVDMENIRPTVRNAEMLYENAVDSFKSILGISAQSEIVLAGDISAAAFSGVSTEALPASESLEISGLRKTIASLEAQRSALRSSSYTPSLSLSWNTSPLYSFSGGNFYNASGTFSLSLRINPDNFLPWSGARTQIDNISDNIMSAQIQLNDTIQNRDNRVNQHIRNVQRIAESLEALKLNVDLAQSNYQMYEEAYRRGAADYQQLRGAGDSLEQTKNRLLQEQYNLIAALLDLEKEINVPFGTLSAGE
jgi:outer membrane protein TolC